MNKQERRVYMNSWIKKWRKEHPDRAKQINGKTRKKSHFGSVERYEEALSKYHGKCSFTCSKEATLVHHIDGKSRCEVGKKQANNSLANLLPLCHLCHMWLHSFSYERQKEIIEKLCGQYTKVNGGAEK